MWNLRKEERLVLIVLISGLTIGLGIKFRGGIPEPAPTSSYRQVLVQVSGAVKNPGWHEVAEDASLESLLEKAGGYLPWADLSMLDLSSILSANTTYYVPAGKLDLNQARTDDLIYLPGIGPELARRIVTYREKRGGFKELSELKEVSGIGEVRFQRIEAMLTIQDE